MVLNFENKQKKGGIFLFKSYLKLRLKVFKKNSRDDSSNTTSIYTENCD